MCSPILAFCCLLIGNQKPFQIFFLRCLSFAGFLINKFCVCSRFSDPVCSGIYGGWTLQHLLGPVVWTGRPWLRRRVQHSPTTLPGTATGHRSKTLRLQLVRGWDSQMLHLIWVWINSQILWETEWRGWLWEGMRRRRKTDCRWTWVRALLFPCPPGAEMAGPPMWSWPEEIGQNRQRNAYLMISAPSQRIS